MRSIFVLTIIGLVFVAFFSFQTGLKRLVGSDWDGTIKFDAELKLSERGIIPTRLPFSHHNSRGGSGDYFVFEHQRKLFASETGVINAGTRYWMVLKTHPVGGADQEVILLHPFGLLSFALTRSGLFVLGSTVWLVLMGWLSTKLRNGQT